MVIGIYSKNILKWLLVKREDHIKLPTKGTTITSGILKYNSLAYIPAWAISSSGGVG